MVNINDAPTGSVTITGTAKQGETLTATHTLNDADGMGTVVYQWKADNIAIGTLPSPTLVLTEAQVGKVITVTASYTDGHGTAENVSSSATGVVSNLNQDSDNDGMPDSFEEQHGLDTLSNVDAGQDKDTDGLTNLEEFQAGTNPELSDTDGDGSNDGQDAFPLNPAVWLAATTITGQVTNNGAGVANALVGAWSAETKQNYDAQANADGTFSISVPPPAGDQPFYYEIKIHVPGFVVPEPVLVKVTKIGVSGVYHPIFEDNHVRPGTPIDANEDGNIDTTVIFKLSAGKTIRGRVVDENGTGLSRVWVDIHNPKNTKFFGTNTDANGFYSVHVEAGKYVAVVWGEEGRYQPSWYNHASNQQTATIIDVTQNSVESIDFRMSSGTSISGTITGGTSGKVFVIARSERTKGWGGKEVKLEADGSTDFTLSGLQEAKDYRLDWRTESFTSGFYSATTPGPVSRKQASLLDTSNGNVSGISITLGTGTDLAVTITGLHEKEEVDAGVWSEMLDMGSWGDAKANAGGVATIVIKGLNRVGTDYRLFINSSTGKYKSGNYKGVPVTTTDEILSDGDSTVTEAGTLVSRDQATLISMAGNQSVKLTMDSGGSISGAINGLVSGQNAWVEAFSERTHGWSGVAVVADTDGKASYSLKGLKRAKDYRVRISGDSVNGGFYSGGTTLAHWNNAVLVDIQTVPSGKENGNAEGIDLTVSAGVSISGSVTGLKTGEWAWVDAWSDSTFSWAGTTVEASTEVTGASVPYQLDGLASAADYKVALDADGYVQQRKGSVNANSSVTGIDFTLSTGGKVSGTISGVGAAVFVWVEAYSPKTKAWGSVGAVTDSNGAATYTIDGLSAADDYVVSLRTEGKTFFYKTDGITPVWNQHSGVTVTAGATEGIHFSLTSAANMVFKLSGSVALNPQNDDLVVEVMAWSADGVGRQLSRIGGGNFTLKGLPSGSYTVEVSADGYIPQRTKSVTLSSGVVSSQEWTTGMSGVGTVAVAVDTSGLSVTLTSGITLSGTVKDSAGATLSGVWVNAWDNGNAVGSGAVTNANGLYSIDGLPGGTYTVEVWTATGKISKSHDLSADNATLNLDLVKETGGIQGTVVNASKIAKQGALVLIYNNAGNQVAATATDANGAFKVEGLTPNGTYTVKIFGDDNLSVSSSYSEKAGVAVAESAIDVGTMTLN